MARWLVTAASVTGTTVADASGNNNTATVVGGPLTFGHLSAQFNAQQYLDSPLAPTTAQLSIMCWFMMPNLTTGNNARPIANSHTNGDFGGFQLEIDDGGGAGQFDVGNGTAFGSARWTQQLVAGTWYHYAGVYDGTAVRAYLNGAQVASGVFAGGNIAPGLAPHINVARDPAVGGTSFIGSIYDVRIFERALSPAEIAAIAAPIPVDIVFSTAQISIPDNAPQGTLLTRLTVVMSDGSAFTGSLSSSNTTFFTLTGNTLVTQHTLTPADDGVHTTTITATQSGHAFAMTLELTK